MAKRDGFDLAFSSEAINQLLVDQMPDDLRSAAEKVASSARARLPDDVEVDVIDGIGENGRPYSMVTIVHPSGMARQAKDGVLSKSASENGLDITRYDV